MDPMMQNGFKNLDSPFDESKNKIDIDDLGEAPALIPLLNQPDDPFMSVSPEEISAMVLTKMKKTAGAYLSKDVTHAVVTVPPISMSLNVLPPR